MANVPWVTRASEQKKKGGYTSDYTYGTCVPLCSPASAATAFSTTHGWASEMGRDHQSSRLRLKQATLKLLGSRAFLSPDEWKQVVDD